ncbi:MAG TPA: polysaccharide biosynthesis C-terminal domain-containing protein, partial [Ktedonobacteraceae bacterium]
MLFTQSYSTTRKRGIVQPGSKQICLAIGTTCVSISTYAITARTLGLTAFGNYAFLHWIATVSTPLIGIGMTTFSSSQLVNMQSRETLSSIGGIFYFLWYRQYRSIWLYGLLYLLLALPFYQVFHIGTPLLLLLSNLAVLPLFLNNIVGITLRSLRRPDLLAILQLCGALITLSLIVIASQFDGGHMEIFLLAFALSGTLTLILAVVCIARQLPIQSVQPPGIFLRKRLKQSFIHTPLPILIDAIIWQQSEILLLALWRSPAEIGLYTISVLISSSIIQITPFLLSTWILPFFLRRQQGHHYLSPYDAFVKTSCYMAFLAVPICILVMFSSPYLVSFGLGAGYLPLIKPLRILLISSVFGSIATVSLTRLAAGGQQKATYSINTAAVLLNIVLAIPCTMYWGISGAALACMVAQL